MKSPAHFHSRKRRPGLESLESRQLLAAELGELDLPQPRNVHSFGELFIFARDDPDWGREPWISDGTAAGTRLLKDICHGPGDSSPGQYMTIGDHVYFIANDGVNEREFWRSDGTPEGTVRVTDSPEELGDVGTFWLPGGSGGGTAIESGLLYSLGEYHTTRLWFQPFSGEPAIDLSVGFEPDSDLDRVAAVGPYVVFTEDGKYRPDGTNIDKLWISDGTIEGTHEVVGFESKHWHVFLFDSSPHLVDGSILLESDWQLVQIDPDGTSTVLTDPELHERVDELVITDDATIFKAENGLWRFNHADQSFEQLLDDDEFQTHDVEQVIDVGSNIVFVYDPRDLPADVWTLWKIDGETGEVTELTDAPNVQRNTDVISFGGMLFYTTPKTDGVGQFVSYNVDTGENVWLEHIDSNDSFEMYTVGDRVLYTITDPQRTVLRSAESDSRRGRVDLRFDSSDGITLDRLESVGDTALANLSKSASQELVHIDLDTGLLHSIAARTLPVNPYELPISSTRATPLGRRHVFYSNGFRIWGNDGTRDGTSMVYHLGADTNGLIPAGDFIYFSAGRQGVGRFGVDSPVEFYPLSGFVRIEPDEGGILFNANGYAVWRWDNESPEPVKLIDDVRDHSFQPHGISDDSDPLADQVLFYRGSRGQREYYVSDGTPEHSGLLVRDTELRSMFENAGLRNFEPNLVSSQRGAVAARMSARGNEQTMLVQRPTEATLQPFFPLDSGRLIRSAFRLPHAWLGIRMDENRETEIWRWDDDAESPVQLDDPPPIWSFYSQKLAGWTAPVLFNGYLVSEYNDTETQFKSVTATNGSGFIDFRDATNIQLDKAWSLRVVGASESGVLLRAFTEYGSSYGYVVFDWDLEANVATVIEPLTTINFEQRRAPFRVYALDEYRLVYDPFVGQDWYVVPRTITQVTSNAQQTSLVVSETEVTVSDDLGSPMTHPVNVGSVTSFEASNASIVDVQLDLLPLHGLRLNLADGATLRLHSDNTLNQVTYAICDDRIVVKSLQGSLIIQGRDLKVIDDLPTQSRQVRFSPAEEQMQVSSDATATYLRVTGSVTTATLGVTDDSSPITVLTGGGIDRVTIDPSYRRSGDLNILSDVDQSRRDQLTLPDDYRIVGTENELGRLITTIVNGDAAIRFDASTSPLHNMVQSGDVNQDGQVTARDALAVINMLNSEKHRDSDNPRRLLPDVNGDNQVTAQDALFVINQLRRQTDQVVVAAERVDLAIADWDEQQESRLF